MDEIFWRRLVKRFGEKVWSPLSTSFGSETEGSFGRDTGVSGAILVRCLEAWPRFGGVWHILVVYGQS